VFPVIHVCKLRSGLSRKFTAVNTVNCTKKSLSFFQITGTLARIEKRQPVAGQSLLLHKSRKIEKINFSLLLSETPFFVFDGSSNHKYFAAETLDGLPEHFVDLPR